MKGIMLLTYAEAKENFNNIEIEEIDDDVYGFVINNIFMPVKLEGSNDFIRFNSYNDENINYQENYYLKA